VAAGILPRFQVPSCSPAAPCIVERERKPAHPHALRFAGCAPSPPWATGRSSSRGDAAVAPREAGIAGVVVPPGSSWGSGLHGHCIPIDPFYLTWKAREFDFETRFVELAGEINQNMPYYCRSRASQALNHGAQKSLSGSDVLVLGVAYSQTSRPRARRRSGSRSSRRSSTTARSSRPGTILFAGSRIGAPRGRGRGGAILCLGIEVGEEAFVGAGAVVTKDVPSRVVVVGSPAQAIRRVTDDELLGG
jgi:hypothetical protein